MNIYHAAVSLTKENAENFIVDEDYVIIASSEDEAYDKLNKYLNVKEFWYELTLFEEYLDFLESESEIRYLMLIK